MSPIDQSCYLFFFLFYNVLFCICFIRSVSRMCLPLWLPKTSRFFSFTCRLTIFFVCVCVWETMHRISYKRDDRLVLSRQNDRNLQDEDIGTRQRFSIYPDNQNSCWKGKHPKISACYIRCSSGSS